MIKPVKRNKKILPQNSKNQIKLIKKLDFSKNMKNEK